MDSSFLVPKISAKFPRDSPNRGGVDSNRRFSINISLYHNKSSSGDEIPEHRTWRDVSSSLFTYLPTHLYFQNIFLSRSNDNCYISNGRRFTIARSIPHLRVAVKYKIRRQHNIQVAQLLNAVAIFSVFWCMFIVCVFFCISVFYFRPFLFFYFFCCTSCTIDIINK